jgi:hypothetical protein
MWVSIFFGSYGDAFFKDGPLAGMLMQLPDRPAVYAIYFDDPKRLQYFGSTINLRARMANSKWRKEEEEEVYLKYSESQRFGDWAMREMRLINRLAPPQNKLHKDEHVIWHRQMRAKHGWKLDNSKTTKVRVREPIRGGFMTESYSFKNLCRQRRLMEGSN